MLLLFPGMAMAAVALAPMAHADFHVGGYNVTNCTFTWDPGPTISGKVSSHDCIDAFLVLAHDDNLVSHPTYAGSTSDHQLEDDALVACYYYDKAGLWHGPHGCECTSDRRHSHRRNDRRSRE
jgi:hypothetical protein